MTEQTKTIKEQIIDTFGLKDNKCLLSEGAGSDCIDTLTKRFFGIVDNKDKPCQLTFDETCADFLVNNPAEDCIDFIRIDHCLFLNSEVPCEIYDKKGQCDFAIISKSEFVLVDIKSAKLKQRRNKIDVAVRQICATLRFLLSKGIDFSCYQKKEGKKLFFIAAVDNEQDSTQEIPRDPNEQAKKNLIRKNFSAQILRGNNHTLGNHINMEKSDVEHMERLSPAISIEQTLAR